MNNEEIEDLISGKNRVIKKLEEMIDTILNEPWFTEECPLSCVATDEEEKPIIETCGCYDDGENCEDYKKCWLKYFERKVKDGRNAR